MRLLDYFSSVKLMEGSTLFSFSAISSILMFWCKKKSILSIYLKYVMLLGSLYLKRTDSKTSRNRQYHFPRGGHIFVC